MQVPSNASEVKKYHTWMGEDGICRTKVKEGSDISLEDAMENTVVVTSFFKDKKFPIMIDARGIKSMSREARNHFSARGRDSKTNSFGIIVKSPISRVVGNFFLGISKPSVPTKLFENEEEAKQWLMQFI